MILLACFEKTARPVRYGRAAAKLDGTDFFVSIECSENGYTDEKEGVMPSFDIVSELDLQEVDNAVNNVRKEVDTRYDFRGVVTEMEFNRKTKTISLVTGDDMKIRAIRDMLISHFVRRKVDPKSMEFGEPENTSRGQLKQEIRLHDGIDKDNARKLVKMIKDSKLKVQAAIQDEQVRVTGKKIDDLQAVIALLKDSDFELPLQYVNMKK
jgi:uncharacterized protein YajQ (UPF0234 family)